MALLNHEKVVDQVAEGQDEAELDDDPNALDDPMGSALGELCGRGLRSARILKTWPGGIGGWWRQPGWPRDRFQPPTLLRPKEHQRKNRDDQEELEHC